MPRGHRGGELSRKQRGRLTYCETLLKNIHTLPCAPGETSGKQELTFRPSGPRGQAGGVFPATCARTSGTSGTSGSGEESWPRGQGAGVSPGFPARVPLCPRKPAPSLGPACPGSSDRRPSRMQKRYKNN